MSKDNTAITVLVITTIIGLGIALYLYFKKKDDPVIPPTCPAGTVWDGTQCAPVVCPEGTVWDGTQCAPVVCPEGTVWDGTQCAPHTGDVLPQNIKITLVPIGGAVPEMTVKLSGIAGDTPLELIQTTINHVAIFPAYQGLYNIHILRPDLGNFWQFRATISTWGGSGSYDISLDVFPPIVTTELTLTVGRIWGTELVEWVNIRLQKGTEAQITAITNVSGTVIINNIPEGDYLITMTKPGYNNYVGTHHIAGATQLLHLTLTELDCPAGYVRDALTGNCISVTCPIDYYWNGFECIAEGQGIICPPNWIWNGHICVPGTIPTAAPSPSPTAAGTTGPCGKNCLECAKRYDCPNYLNTRSGGGCNCR